MWPLATRAQQSHPTPVIGLLSIASPAPFAKLVAALRRGLQETGYVEGQNLDIEFRWAEGHFDRLAPLAADLVSRQVTVIVATGGPAPALAAKAATTTIPIVFNVGADPVKLGLVESLNRPNSNITGVSIFSNALGPKDVELLHELLPAVSAIALLGNPNNANFQSAVPDVRAAADALKQHLEVLTASTESELEAVFATMVQHRVGALIVMADPFLIARRRQLVELAGRHIVPAIYPDRMFADVGGLMSYGASVLDLSQRVGVYVGKILKGAKTAELPIQQSTKVELVINLTTAKVLGLIVPPQLLARADEVIE